MNNKKIKRLFILVLLSVGCAQVTSLNLTKHQFGVQPRKIIWLQVAGLTKEHIALLKYDYSVESKQTSFEKFLCYGNAWEYNLYDMRPSYDASFISQLTGKANTNNSCKDYDHKPVWDYLSKQGYKAGMFRTEKRFSSKQKTCSQEESFHKNLTSWNMNKVKGSAVKYFHLEKEEAYLKGETYFDTSCLTGECFNSESKNIVATFERFMKNSKRGIYIVQDESYLEALRSNNFIKAKRKLSELDLAIRYFQNYVRQNNDALLLLSTVRPLDISFPEQGVDWDSYIKKGSKIRVEESELLADIFAIGARSENFCGIYNQSDILKRIFSGAKQQGLELEFINPFN